MPIIKSPAIHPGEILRELYLEPLDMSAYALPKHRHIPRARIERMVTEKLGITADTALRLAKFFKTTADYWLNLQNAFDSKSTVPSLNLTSLTSGN